MSIKSVLKMGHPTLLSRSEEVSQFDTPELHSLIGDMKDTMTYLNGAGIAAPQIGVLKRVVIFGFENNIRYPTEDSVPFTILINPIIEPLSEDMEEGIEGCLSVPGLSGSVPRYTKIRYRGFDPEGEVIDRTVNDFHARVVQHECDHLDGILCLPRARPLY
jgi:peptide deformylase